MMMPAFQLILVMMGLTKIYSPDTGSCPGVEDPAELLAFLAGEHPVR